MFLHLFPHSLQSTCHFIIFWFWNCALFCISFNIDCNRLAILSFSNLKIVRCPAIHSSFIAIDFTSHYLWNLKLCPLLHLFPHTLQSTSHPIISDFKIVRLPAPLSSFSAIDLPSDHLCIFKLCVFLHLFQNHCNWLVIR